MGAVQIYLLISRLIATARLEMTVGSKPITSVFTVLNSTAVTASWCRRSNKLAQISLLGRGRVKDKGDESIWVCLRCNGWWYICIFPMFTSLKCLTWTLPACAGLTVCCFFFLQSTGRLCTWIDEIETLKKRTRFGTPQNVQSSLQILPNKFVSGPILTSLHWQLEFRNGYSFPQPAEKADLINTPTILNCDPDL